MGDSRAMAHTRRMTDARAVGLWPMIWPGLGLALGLGFGLLCAAHAWPFCVDDAFIVARYARRLGAGLGYTFQAGAPSDGVTGPLWLFLLAAGVRLGWEPVLTGKLLGLTAVAAALVVILRQSSARAGGGRRAVFLAGLLASAAPLWIWAIGGLETGLATLLVTLMLCGVSARPDPRPVQVAIAAALLPWLRPELVPLALATAAGCVWRRPKSAALLLLSAASGISSVLAFRQLTFGHFLPLSAYAKPASLAHGLAYLLTCLRSPAAIALLLLLCVAFGNARRADRALLGAFLMHAAVIACAGGDWMAGARLFVPIVPMACLVASLAWERLLLRRRLLALVLAALVLPVRGCAAYAETKAARTSGELREQRLPALLAALSDVPEPIVLLDIGAVGYRSDKTLIDLGGLTEAQIAYAPGGHIAKRLDSVWLREQAPGAFVLHSRVAPRIDDEGHVRWFAGYAVERHVLSFPWVLRDFRVREVVAYDRDYFYMVLTRQPHANP
jgi:hypothetical protein